MSHVTRMDALEHSAGHDVEWIPSHVTHMNESPPSYERVMSHITHMSVACPRYEGSMSHMIKPCQTCMSTSHGTHLSASCHTCEQFKSHMNKACHACEGVMPHAYVMSHIRMSHVTHWKRRGPTWIPFPPPLRRRSTTITRDSTYNPLSSFAMGTVTVPLHSVRSTGVILI